MALDIDREIAALRRLTVPQLRSRHQELFGEPPRSAHKQHLVRRIVWRIQALAEGDLSERGALTAAKEHEPGQALCLMDALRESVAQSDRAVNGRKPAGRPRKKVATTRKAGSRRRSSKKSA